MLDREQLAAALGDRKADLVIRGGLVADVLTGKLRRADVAVCGGMITGVGEGPEGAQYYDAAGKVICPGFIDSHLHLESAMVSPDRLVGTAARFGTTTFVADPHEAANVCGCDGIDYILDVTAGCPADVFVMVPSCVPATEFEDNGCRLTAQKMKKYLNEPRVLGLGEVMDCYAVLGGKPDMAEKLELFRDKKIDGHAGFLDDRQLAAYRAAGITSDHECVSWEVALRELEAGLTILIREGTGAKNLDAIVGGLVGSGVDTHRFCFCTDDKHIEEIKREGHINANIRKAVALGLDPIAAVRMASLNAAQHYGLDDRGAIAPGMRADIVIVDNLKQLNVEAVWHRGERVPEEYTAKVKIDKKLKNTVNIGPIDPQKLELRIADGAETPVIGVRGHQIGTDLFMRCLPAENGLFKPDSRYDKVAVFERHRATGKVGVAALENFGLRGGAIASTYGHDSHNLIAVGDSDADILAAVEELVRVGGGYTVVEHGRPVSTLPLPIMGMMTDADADETTAIMSRIIKKTREMGVNPEIDPFVTMSFLALPVIPHLRITPRGLFDTQEQKFL